MRKAFIVEIICFLLMLLFMYAAFSKLSDYEKFVVQIGQSPMLTNFSGFIAWFIPAIELICCILLAWPRFRLKGLYMAFSLMVMFTAYIVAITQFSEYVPCSCGGVLDKLGWTEHLIFNAFFNVLAIIGILLVSVPNKSSRALEKISNPETV